MSKGAFIAQFGAAYQCESVRKGAEQRSAASRIQVRLLR